METTPPQLETAEKNSERRNAESKRVKDVVSKSLALIGLIALLALGAWSTFQMVRGLPNLSSRLSAVVTYFSARVVPLQTTPLYITLGSYHIKSGTPFTLSWMPAPKETETYALTYECADALAISVENGMHISCGEPHSFSTNTGTIKLTAFSPDNRFLDAALKLTRMDGDIALAEDTVLLTIVNDRVSMNPVSSSIPAAQSGNTTPPPARPTTGTPTYTTVAVPRVSDPSGYIDLEVRVLAVGILDSNTSVFTPTANILRRNERGAIQFVVKNIGTKTSDPWSFEVELPTSPNFTFHPRETQKGVAPGESVIYTLGFDKIVNRETGEIAIAVDPDRDTAESNRSNNTATITVTINR